MPPPTLTWESGNISFTIVPQQSSSPPLLPSPPLALRRLVRTIKPPDRLLLFSALDHISIPTSYKQVVESVEWSRAMQEHDALEFNIHGRWLQLLLIIHWWAVSGYIP